jgi:hypothetical protein
MENFQDPNLYEIPKNLQILIVENNFIDFKKVFENHFREDLNEIEKELNIFSHELCREANLHNLLSYQIRNIQLCLDILLSIENGEECLSICQSSKKKKPFCFNILTNLYEAR